MEAQESVSYLLEWIKFNAPLSALMWCCNDTKSPAFSHKDGWSNDDFIEKWDNDEHTETIAILCEDIFVLDFDTEESYNELLNMFPDDLNLNNTISEKTRKGYHIIFERPESFEVNKIFDKAGAFSIKGIDIKTKCSTGTRGVLVCSPSSNKEWITAPWNGELKGPSKELEEWIINNYKHSSTISKIPKKINENINLDLIINIINNISDDNSNEYESWRNIVFALLNIQKNYNLDYDKIIELIHDFSKISENYDENKVNKFISNYKGEKGFGFIHLKNILKNDNIEKYNELFSSKSNIDTDFITFIYNNSDHTSASIYSKKYKDILYYTSSNGWIKYNEDIALWELDINNDIEVILNNDISNYFLNFIKINYEKYMSDNNIKKEDKDLLYKKKSKLEEKVGSVTFAKNVITKMRGFLLIKNDKEFFEKFDNISYLLPVANNKVIDLRTTTIYDRNKEHYFSKTTNIVFKPDRPNKNIVREYIRQLLMATNDKYIDCFLDHMGYIITGEKSEKLCLIFYGKNGNNGKTTLEEILNKGLGDFATTAPKKIFIATKSESVHETEFFDLIGKRLATQHEFGDDDIFNYTKLKEITGGDRIKVRECGSRNYKSLNLYCKLLISTNNIPNFPITEETKAFITRLRAIHFCNVFEKSNKKQQELFNLKDDIFTEFIYHSKNFYDKDTIELCSEVLEYQQTMLKEKDIITNFIETEYEITNSIKDRIKKTDIYDNFRYYCEANKIIGKNILGRNTFYEQFEKKFNLKIYARTHYEKIKKIDSNIYYSESSNTNPSDLMSD